MQRFHRVVVLYMLGCVLAATVIVARGDGPHPRVLATYPPDGSRFWPGGIARLVFSRPMDPVGVENALQVTPPVPLQEAWVGTALYFQPVYDWQPDTTYEVRLSGAVADAQGRALARPISFSFRVHYLGRLGFCVVGGVRNVCEYRGVQARPLTHAARPVLQYAPSPYVSRLIQTDGGSGAAQAQVWDVSPPGSMLAYTSRDGTGLPHLFVTHLDGTGTQQLTFGTANADSDPFWLMGDISTVGYYRQPVHRRRGRVALGDKQAAAAAVPQ